MALIICRECELCLDAAGTAQDFYDAADPVCPDCGYPTLYAVDEDDTDADPSGAVFDHDDF